MIEQKNKNFFSKKKFIFLSISLLVTIAAITVSVLSIVQVNLKGIFRQITAAFYTSHGIGFFLLLILPIYSTLFRYIVYGNGMRRYCVKIKGYDWLIFSFTSRALTIVTPFALGAQPFNYFWLRANKLPHSTAVSVITCSSFVEVAINAIITWPSFIYLAVVRYYDIVNLPHGSYCFYLIIAGMFLDLLVTSIYFLTGFSRHCHIFFATIFNQIAKFLHLKYKKKEQIYCEYKTNALIKKEFIQELKRIIDPLLVALLTLIFSLIEYSSMFFSLQLLGNSTPGGSNLTYMSVFNSINVASTANSFIPIPGGEGTTQFTLRIFLKSFCNDSSGIKFQNFTQIINGGIVIWRFFENYLQIFVGLSFLPLIIYYYTKKIKQKIN